MDLYVLSSHKHLFEDPRFRIVRIYDYKASYGVVLTGHSMKLEECFTEHIKGDSAEVYESIEENIKILKVCKINNTRPLSIYSYVTIKETKSGSSQYSYVMAWTELRKYYITGFGGETSSSVAKCRLFSQATSLAT